MDQDWELLVVGNPVAIVEGDGFDVHGLHPLVRRFITFVIQRRKEGLDISPLSVGQ